MNFFTFLLHHQIERYNNFLYLVEILLVIYQDLIGVINHVFLSGINGDSICAFKVMVVGSDHVVVLILSLIQIEPYLSNSECYAVSRSWAVHHLAATHEIIHAVLQLWLQSYRVNVIEVYELISGNLHLLIASYVIDKSSLIKRVKYLPPFNDDIFINFFHLLEKQDLVGGSCDQKLVIDEVNLCQIRAIKFLILELFYIIAVDGNRLAKSIETMDLKSQQIEEAIIWIVQI